MSLDRSGLTFIRSVVFVSDRRRRDPGRVELWLFALAPKARHGQGPNPKVRKKIAQDDL